MYVIIDLVFKMNFISKIKYFYHKYNLNIIISIISNIILAIFNLVLIINGGPLWLLGSILFYLLISAIRAISFILYKKNKTGFQIGLFYAISSNICYLLIPSLLTYVLIEKEYVPFFIEWFTYGYALYATLKMVFALLHIKRTFIEKNIYMIDIKISNIISALYTIFLLAFILINQNGTMDNNMQIIMIMLNIFVIISVIIGLIIMYKILKFDKK